VALKVEMGSGVNKWGKKCGGLMFLWSLCVFGYLSVVVEEGVCVRDCRVWGCVKLE
jgi:hypothetical protein